jgi:nicotinamidase-related amidase
MENQHSLRDGAWHICVDMQLLFTGDSEWAIPWFDLSLPQVKKVTNAMPGRTVFTRFIPPERPEDTRGMWRPYWEEWRNLTRERIPPELLELAPELRACVPEARVFDKNTYSPWTHGRLQKFLDQQNCRTVVITGGETDMCVLATVLGAIDLGYKVIIVRDALCSAMDETHDAVLKLYRKRFSQQIESMSADEFTANFA